MIKIPRSAVIREKVYVLICCVKGYDAPSDNLTRSVHEYAVPSARLKYARSFDVWRSHRAGNISRKCSRYKIEAGRFIDELTIVVRSCGASKLILGVLGL